MEEDQNHDLGGKPSLPGSGIPMLGVGSAQVLTPGAHSRTPGGFWRRFVATLVDTLIVWVLTMVLASPGYLFEYMGERLGMELPPGLRSEIAAQVAWMFLNLVATAWYFGYFYSRTGTCPGKKLLDLEVIDFETGGRISFGRAAIRETIGKTVSGLVFFLGFLMAAFRSDKRALHDTLAGTQVTRRS